MICLPVCAVVIAAMPLACSKQPAGQATGNKTIGVLCSTFPMYLFTQAVVAGRENVRVEPMLSAGVGCPHDYSLTPQDMQKLASAQVFIANGLGMEEFLGEPLRKANPNINLVDTSAGVKDLIILKTEGADGPDPNSSYHRIVSLNPHLFASPRMAAQVVRNIAAGLSKIDPAGSELYAKNAEAYAASLEKLADDFKAVLKDLPPAARRIVTEHAVFDYLARDNGLEVVAVVEENPGQEPTAAEMLEMVKRIKASGAAAVFTEPQYPAKVGQTIAKEVGIPVRVLDPVASGPEDATPEYYVKTMRSNLDTLVKTLAPKAK